MATRRIKDVVAEEGRLKRFMNSRLIRALSHPIREHLLAVFNERIASASEIGRELDLGVPEFYSYVEELEKLGFIERVESKPRRGATEHFFKAKATLFFDDRAWMRVPASVRSDISMNEIQSILDDVVRASRIGAFARTATHTSWLPGVFDQRGWEEARALIDETLERLMGIQSRSRERVARSGEPGISATIGLLGFETPPVPNLRSGIR